MVVWSLGLTALIVVAALLAAVLAGWWGMWDGD